jgi:hypothetical protein
MPNYSVTFDDGKSVLVWASNKDAAKAKAQKKYARKTGRRGHIKKVN